MNKKNSKTLLLASGIPTFIGIGFFEFMTYKDFDVAVLVALLGALLVGFFLFLISNGFAHPDRKVWWITVLHFLLIPVAGVIITVAYYFLARYAPVGRWKEIAVPPEQITHFLPSADPTIFGSSLFVQGVSGNTYSYDCVTYEGCNWVQKEYQPDNQDSDTDTKSLLKNRLIPIPPGRIVESQYNIGKGPDFETGIMYIRLADGRLFFLTQFSNAYMILFILFGFSLTGLITGISTSIAVFILRPKRTQNIN